MRDVKHLLLAVESSPSALALPRWVDLMRQACGEAWSNRPTRQSRAGGRDTGRAQARLAEARVVPPKVVSLL